MINAVKLIVSLLVPLLTGFAGSYFTIASIPTWYAGIIKPWFNPPNWIFGPVWTLLYLMMGVSLYLLWNGDGEYKKAALIFFVIQLVLNLLWSIIFFGLHSPFFAFCEIILLWFAIAATLFFSSKVSPLAAGLLIPYLLWVSFAAVLNWSIYLLNK